MAEIKEFVVNDRRKFTAEGEARPDAPPSEPKQEKAARAPEPAPSTAEPEQTAPPPLTPEQTAEVSRAYDATVDRIETAIRSANPGMERIPEMTFERVIHSLYMQAMLQLGMMAPPDQKPQVDILGARQTIDMLAVLATKSTGNLTPEEATLMDNALFELRMGFLEMTQALARQAQAKQAPGAPGVPPVPGAGPSIVR